MERSAVRAIVVIEKRSIRVIPHEAGQIGSPAETYLQPYRSGKQLANRRYSETRRRTAETVSSESRRVCGNLWP